jgi:aminoglycoside phosphotransferase (APT) family kinase protein
MVDLSRQAVRAVQSLTGRDSAYTALLVPTGRFNTTYLVSDKKERFVVRIAPPDDAGFVFYEKNMMAQEPEIHELVLEKTKVPVPRILLYDDTRRIMDRNYLVMEYMEGTPLSETSVSRRDLDRIFRQVGAWLGQVHRRITAEKYGYLGAHRPMEPAKDWNSAFTVMWNRMADGIQDIGEYTPKECEYVKSVLSRHLTHFTRKVPASLLHMDVWAQNILVSDKGEAAGLLDWDRALYGDPEIEFAVLDYCGVSEPAFWEGYGEERDPSPSARVRNLFYVLYEIQKYVIIHKLRRKNPSSARGYKAQAMRLMAQLG